MTTATTTGRGLSKVEPSSLPATPCTGCCADDAEPKRPFDHDSLARGARARLRGTAGEVGKRYSEANQHPTPPAPVLPSLICRFDFPGPGHCRLQTGLSGRLCNRSAGATEPCFQRRAQFCRARHTHTHTQTRRSRSTYRAPGEVKCDLPHLAGWLACSDGYLRKAAAVALLLR